MKARHSITTLFLAGAFSLGLTACGDRSAEADTERKQSPGTTVRGGPELTRNGVTGPSEALIASWLTGSPRVDVRLIPEGWQVTTIRITEWVNDGDEVDPYIRGNFTGQAEVVEPRYRTVEKILDPSAFDRNPGPEDYAHIVERVRDTGETIELFGKFTSTKLAGEWMPVSDEPGVPGVVLTFLDTIPFDQRAEAESAITAKELILTGSARETAYRELVAAARERLREEQQRERETRQRAAETEAARQAAVESERRAAYFPKATPKAEEALSDRIWVVPNNHPQAIITTLRFDSWDHDTGTAEGITRVLGPDIALHRRFTAQLAESASIRFTLTEGEDLVGSVSREAQPPVTLVMTLNASGDGLSGTWQRSRNARGTLDFVTADPQQVAQNTVRLAALPLGETFRATFGGSGSAVQSISSEITLLYGSEALGLVVGEARSRDTMSGSVWHRFFKGTLDADPLVLVEFQSGADDAPTRGGQPWRWELVFLEDGPAGSVLFQGAEKFRESLVFND